MFKQKDLIQMENNVEVAVKANPILKFLKYALIGVTAFIVLVILFAVGSSVINPAVEGVMQKIGLNDTIVTTDASPVAHAWTCPALGLNGGQGGLTFSTNSDANNKTVASLTNTGYNTQESLWHWAYSQYGGSVNAGNGNFTTGSSKDALELKIIYYVDIRVDELMRNAIKNGQLSQITISMKSETGGNVSWASTADCNTYYSFFLLSTNTSSYETKDASINNFPTSYHRSDTDQNQYTKYSPESDNTKKPETVLTIDLTGVETKIRFGFAWYINYASRTLYECEFYANAPTISSALKPTGYSNGKMQFKVNTGSQASLVGGTIEPVSGNNYSNFSTYINSSSTYTVPYSGKYGIQAVPNYGYYFSGWKITGGSISYGNNYQYTKLEIPGGGYVTPTTVVITACFRPITTSYVGSDITSSLAIKYWDYLQDENGTAIAQGPSITTPTIDDSGQNGSFEVIGGSLDANNKPYNSGYNYKYASVEGSLIEYGSNNMPYNAGSYVMVMRIFVANSTGVDEAEVGYVFQYFNIEQIDISGTDGNTVTFVGFEDDSDGFIDDHVFNNKAYEPTPDQLRIKISGFDDENSYFERYYILNRGTDKDYTIYQYFNNVYVTTLTYVTALGITTNNTALQNFKGQNANVYFNITPLDISDFIVTASFAQEIQEKYGILSGNTFLSQGLVYNGYQQRPDVIKVRLTNPNNSSEYYDVYRSQLYASQYELYGYESEDLENASYKPLFRIVNVDIDESGIYGDYMNKDETKAYFNNVNVCTHDGTSSSSSAYFYITMGDDGSGDLVGTAKVNFNIEKMDLEDKEYTVENQSVTPTFKGGAITPTTEIVYVTTKNNVVWVYQGNNQRYGTNTDVEITYAFATNGDVAYSEEVASKVGGALIIGDDVIRLNNADYLGDEIVGQEYFTTWSGTFSNAVFANNVNVTRDENDEVIAGATITVDLSGNTENEVTTLFKILPLDLSAEYQTNKLIGFFSKTGSSHDTLPTETYKASKFESLPSGYKVYAHVNNSNSGTALTSSDIVLTYGNAERDNVNVNSGGIIIVEGIGNYTGTISDTFIIQRCTPMTVTAVSTLAPYDYTGKVPVYNLESNQEIVFNIDGVEFTLVYGVDFISQGVQSNNVEVSDVDQKKNYVYVDFSNNYIGENIPIYFAIIPKALSNIDNSDGKSIYTNFSKTGGTNIYYDGTVKKNLSVTCYGNGIEIESEAMNGDLVVMDGSTYLKYGVDFVFSGEWGDESTNLNAGNEAYFVIEGMGNYQGTLNVSFIILPKDISDANVDGIILSGYSFSYTGEVIKPTVNSVEYSKNLILDASDYEVSHGNAMRDSINVKSGGVVIITGVGNFTGSVNVEFEITPIDQTLTFNSDQYAHNESAGYLQREVNDSLKDIGVEFFVNKDVDGKVILKATTTAVSSGKASNVEFVVDSNKVEFSNYQTTIENGIATTTAEMTFNGYGVIYVKAKHVDAYGNYNAVPTTESKFAVCAKRQNDAEGIPEIMTMVYGDKAVPIDPDFLSGNRIKNYSISVDKENILEFVKFDGVAFSLRPLNVSDGYVEVTISHEDFAYVNESNYLEDEYCYVAFAKTFKVKVEKRELHISIKDTSVEYGGTPTFTYLYRTPVYDTNGDFVEYTDGLVNGDTADKGNSSVISGIKNNYSSVLHGAVGDHEINTLADSNTIIQTTNYDIHYVSGILTVTKKNLEVFINDTNTISRKYGEENPTTYRISYSGLIRDTDANEFVDSKKPYLIYVDSNGNAVTTTTNAGTYTISVIVDEEPSNYVFVFPEVTMQITATEVGISLAGKNVNYNGSYATPSDAEITGVSGGTLPNGNVEYGILKADGMVGDLEEAKNAGTYTVRVIWTSASEETNYRTTQKDFANAIVINKIAPTIIYADSENPYGITYTGETFVVADVIRPTIQGVSANDTPTIQKMAEIWIHAHQEAGDVNYDTCHLAGNYAEVGFTQEAPIAKGYYDIIFIYKANPNDNYTDVVARFNHSFEISTGRPTISLRQGMTIDYDGLGHGLDIATNFNAFTWRAEGSTTTTIIDSSASHLEYLVNGVYTTELPVNAGTYTVRVCFTPVTAQEELVNACVEDFAGALVINAVNVLNSNYIDLNFSGERRRDYTGYGQPLNETADILLRGVSGGTTPQGSISVVYVKDGKTYQAPVNAGTYSIHVTYYPASGDNYTAEEGEVKIFENRYVIDKVGVEIALTTTATYVYNGLGRTVEGATFYGVLLENGTFEIPGGTLSYLYKKAGTSQSNYSTTLPKDVGTYDVKISYVPTENDNYYNKTSKEFTKVITITKATPTIIINEMTFKYGDVIVVDYTIRGAQYDLEGPMNDVAGGTATVTISYGTRYTTTSGTPEYEWSSTAPNKSGKYSVRIQFEPSASSNYASASQRQFDVITIQNILPEFELESKTVAYDGNRHVANEALVYYGTGENKTYYTKWDGEEEGTTFYRGTLGYEYSKSGTDMWTTVAPSAVGVYDVRVRYYENTTSDVFSSNTATYLGALVIETLVIKVMPIYGQGHVYDGTSIDGGAIAYAYSYVRDGYTYMVYTRAGDLEKDEIIDLSKAEYVSQDGYVYTIVTDTSMLTDAWLSYYERALTLVSGNFMDGDTLVEFDFSALGVSEGKGALEANDKDYVVDLDLNVVYLNDGIDYVVGTQNGYYFSIVDGKGAVNVIEIIPSNVIYATEGSTSGIYTVTTAGKQTIYTVDLINMTAKTGSEIYDIYTTVGTLSYQNGVSTVQIKVDYSSLYTVTEDGKALYKSANGSAYLIDLNTSKVERVAELNVSSVEFTYVEYRGEETTVVVDVTNLEQIYTSNAYFGKYALRADLSAIINLKDKKVRIQTYYNVVDSGAGFYSFIESNGRNVAFRLEALTATSRPNQYTYTSQYGVSYLIDLGAMIARDLATKYLFDVADERIYQEVEGVEVGFEVDVRDFTYDVVRGGKLYGTTKLYGGDYEVEETTLINGNTWSGDFSIMAERAGSYEILQGSLAIKGNYSLYFVEGIYYDIERAKVTVTFVGEEEAVYDGTNKFISYEIQGVLEGDTIGVQQSYDGDNLNVTTGGYRTVISISTPNYYLEGGVSKWYYIIPATMNEIVVEESKPIIYDGSKHYLELGEVERGATVSYEGSPTAPYFIEPGTYSVVATVSKPNYHSLEVELTLTIVKAKYVVTALEVPGTLKYGDSLPALLCDSTLGTIALDPSQVLLPSVSTYTWTFTPFSQDFYRLYEGNSPDGNTITGTIELKVQKAQAKIEVNGNLTQSETNPSAIVGYVNGLSNNESDLVSIEYVAGDGTRYAKMPTDPGKYTVRITYAGDENYAETVYTTVLTIEQESNFEWLIYVGSVIGGLMILSTVFFLVRRQKKLD